MISRQPTVARALIVCGGSKSSRWRAQLGVALSDCGGGKCQWARPLVVLDSKMAVVNWHQSMDLTPHQLKAGQGASAIQ